MWQSFRNVLLCAAMLGVMTGLTANGTAQSPKDKKAPGQSATGSLVTLKVSGTGAPVTVKVGDGIQFISDKAKTTFESTGGVKLLAVANNKTDVIAIYAVEKVGDANLVADVAPEMGIIQALKIIK